MRYTLQLMVATTCGKKHKPPYYSTLEDRLTHQRWNQTQECWLTFLSEMAALDDPRHSLPRTLMFQRIHVSSAGLQLWAPFLYEWLKLATPDIPSRQVHITSIPAHHQRTHLQCQRINASQPRRSKPYCTNGHEEEGLLWPFTPSRVVHNRGVDNVLKRQQIYTTLTTIF